MSKWIEIQTNTSLDCIIRACDPRGVRGTAALGILAIAGALIAGRAVTWKGAPVTACNDHIFIGRPGTGKGRVIAMLRALANALDVPCITRWPKSHEGVCALLQRTMQRQIDSDNGGPPRFELVHPVVLCILDEQGSLNAAAGRDGLNCTLGGVQTTINITSDGIVPEVSEAVTRKPQLWPELTGVTVIWVRFAQLQNGADFLAATAAAAPGVERRRAVWTVRDDPPCDAAGNVLPDDEVAFYNALFDNADDTFQGDELFCSVQTLFGARMSDAIAAALKGTVRQVTVGRFADPAIARALKAAAHNEEEWAATGGKAAFLLARYWAGVRACVRGSTCANDDDWRWAAALVEQIHTTSDEVLEQQDSETRQRRAYDEVVRHFKRTPFIDSNEEPRSKDVFRVVLRWVGYSDLRRWAFANWGLQNLFFDVGHVNGRHEKCLYRLRTPRNMTPPDPPRGEDFSEWFFNELKRLQAPPAPPTDNPA